MTEFYLLPVIHGQLDAFTHGRKLGADRDFVNICWTLNLTLHLYIHSLYLDLEIYELVPLRVSVFLNDLSAQLKIKW